MVLTLCRPRHVLFAIGATINLLSPHPVFSPLLNPIQGPAQIMPHFYYKIFFYYKIISMSFCNITVSHSSAPWHFRWHVQIAVHLVRDIHIPCQPQSSLISAGPCTTWIFKRFSSGKRGGLFGSAYYFRVYFFTHKTQRPLNSVVGAVNRKAISLGFLTRKALACCVKSGQIRALLCLSFLVC